MILNDSEIKARQGMIEPFIDSQQREGSISYGLSSYGYDVRVDTQFLIFTPIDYQVVDPKESGFGSFVERNVKQHSPVIIPPNSFALGKSVEKFHIPDDVLGICLGKSTYARCGIIVNVTPLEPGWEGVLTIEISNTTSLPARIYGGEGIAQVVFMSGGRPETTYADRSGKYQSQAGITTARI